MWLQCLRENGNDPRSEKSPDGTRPRGRAGGDDCRHAQWLARFRAGAAPAAQGSSSRSDRGIQAEAQKTSRNRQGQFALAHSVCRVVQSLLDVVAFEVRIGCKNISRGHSVGHHADDCRHRDAQSADAWTPLTCFASTVIRVNLIGIIPRRLPLPRTSLLEIQRFSTRYQESTSFDFAPNSIAVY